MEKVERLEKAATEFLAQRGRGCEGQRKDTRAPRRRPTKRRAGPTSGALTREVMAARADVRGWDLLIR